jgi:hypothetical protein
MHAWKTNTIKTRRWLVQLSKIMQSNKVKTRIINWFLPTYRLQYWCNIRMCKTWLQEPRTQRWLRSWWWVPWGEKLWNFSSRDEESGSVISSPFHYVCRYLYTIKNKPIPLAVGIKPEPEARNPKNPNPYPFSPKPGTRTVPAGSKTENPNLVRAKSGNSPRYPNYPFNPNYPRLPAPRAY